MVNTIRQRVLAYIASCEHPVTGHLIAKAVGISYLQAITATNYLYNAGRIGRRGRKFSCRWVRLEPTPHQDAVNDINSFIFRAYRR